MSISILQLMKVRGKKQSDSLVGERLRFGEEVILLTERSDRGIGDNYRGQDLAGNGYVVKFQSGIEYEDRDMFVTDVVREHEAITHMKRRGGHPNIVGDCKISLWQSVPVIALPRIDGEDLQSILEREKKLPVPQAVRYGSQICDGLAYVHKNGMVHKDIKPGNIVMERNGSQKPIIIDFAFAIFAQERDAGPACYGTPWYVAPEVAQGKGAMPQSDLYSLGITLYQMIAGTLPFDGNGIREILRMHLTCPPSRTPLEQAEVPMDVQRVILRALEKDPDKRYQSAANMKDALLEAL